MINEEMIEKRLGKSKDISFRHILIGGKKELPAVLVFVQGLADSDEMSRFILDPLCTQEPLGQAGSPEEAGRKILDGAIYYASVKPTDQEDEVLNGILSGQAALIIDTLDSAILFDVRGGEKRSVGIPNEESTYRSAKDCFVEVIRSNTANIRRRIKSPDLVVDEMILGRQSNTTVGILYLSNICNDKFVTEVKSRLETIDRDRILSVFDIYPYLVESVSTFPQAQITEKPSVASVNIMEGKIAILIDALPYAIVMPSVIEDFLQTESDYNTGFIVASAFRLLRYTLFFVSLIAVAFYIAIVKFHQEMLPTSLAYAIASSKSGTPFPITLEGILLSVAFYALSEAGLRASTALGSSISIVGGLVLGQAAITAKLVSPGVTVVVAIAAIASLAIPNNDLHGAIWVWQFIFIIFGSVFGLFGISVGIMLLLAHLSSIETLGVPFLSPFTLKTKLQLDDSIIRFPMKYLRYRPFHLDPKNKKRSSS